jgi:hypothetical protein
MRVILFSLLGTILIWSACKKEEEPVQEPVCNVSGAISIDTGDAYFTLPTAFTPNGDGRNDHFRALLDKVDTTGFSITVKEGTTVVFQASNPYFIWTPTEYMGMRKAFTLDVRFRTFQGARIETCNKLTIPRTDSFATCAHDIGGLFFEDQVNIATGKFQYPTGEKECP